MFRASFLLIIRSLVLYTQQQIYVIQVLLTACQRDPGSRQQAVSKTSMTYYLLLCMQYQIRDDGQKTCTKHVKFYSKNKFEKLVHLVGFIIRVYHDARYCECQIRQCPNEEGESNETGNVRIDVRMGGVRITIVVAEKQNVLLILSTCLYPLLSSMKCVCTALVMCPVRLYTIYPHIS